MRIASGSSDSFTLSAGYCGSSARMQRTRV